MTRYAAWLVYAAALVWSTWSVPVYAHMTVRVEGAVTHPGRLQLKDGARLSDAALAAGVTADAYPLGAAWLRPQSRRAQVRLKAGILYDLDALHRAALLRGNATQAKALLHLRDWVQGLPVTGRQRAVLAPRVVEDTAADNQPLAAGDVLYYPTRPTYIDVVGATEHRCRRTFHPLAGAQTYLAECPRGPLADRDWVWIIQPDGHAELHGIAQWNRSPAQPLAPGAMVLVPIARRLAVTVDPSLDSEIAQFLATQVIGRPGTTP